MIIESVPSTSGLGCKFHFGRPNLIFGLDDLFLKKNYKQIKKVINISNGLNGFRADVHRAHSIAVALHRSYYFRIIINIFHC